MLRSALIVFVAGWGVWFWLDKEGPYYAMARSLPSGDSLTRDLQVFFDLLKSAHAGPAYTFFWTAHPFVSTLAIVAAWWLAVPLFRSLAGVAERWRRRERSGRPARSGEVPDPPASAGHPGERESSRDI